MVSIKYKPRKSHLRTPCLYCETNREYLSQTILNPHLWRHFLDAKHIDHNLKTK